MGYIKPILAIYVKVSYDGFRRNDAYMRKEGDSP